MRPNLSQKTLKLTIPPDCREEIKGRMFIRIGRVRKLEYGEESYVGQRKIHRLKFNFKFWGATPSLSLE